MTRRDILWSAVEALGSAAFTFLSALVLARLIGPAELGIGAAAVSVHVLLWVTVNALFADALVQCDALDDAMVWSALWSSVAVGVIAMLVQAASGHVLAWLFGDHRLVTMSLLLALPLPLVGAAGVMQGVLTRGRRYRRLALRSLCGQGIGTAVGIWLATAGAGAWAAIGQQALVSGIGALTLVSGTGMRPRLLWRWTAVRALLRTGLPLTASTLALIARYRLFAVMVGGMAGPAVLGQVHIAFRLVDAVRELLFTALWRLMLPVLSEQQHDRSALRTQVDRLLGCSSLVTMPLCALMAAILPSVVSLLLGAGWAPAGRAVEPLVALMALLALMFPSGVALVAVGEARKALFANLIGLVAIAVGVLALRPATPWQAVLVWCGSQLMVSPYALWANSRALGVGMLRPLHAGLWSFGVSLASLTIVLWGSALAGTTGPAATIAVRLILWPIAAAAAILLALAGRGWIGRLLRPAPLR